MDDLISRQAAVDAVNDLAKWYCETYHETRPTVMAVIDMLERLPSEQLEKTQLSEEDTTSDCISRQTAITEFSCCELTPDGGIDANYAIDFLKQLPSAQQWIPCSERLPEKSGLYLTWTKFQYEEEPSWLIINYDADCESFGEWEEHYHPDTLGYLDSEFNEFENVFAWMPLPEPYKERREE